MNAQTKSEIIMLIDDNPIDLYISSRVIKKYDFKTSLIEYSSGLDALDYLKANENRRMALPDIIFVDIFMPVMSGFEFMGEYNQLSYTLKNQCKVYMVSSSLDVNDIIRSKKDKNIIDFHSKPVTQQFLESIHANTMFSHVA